MIQKEYRNRAGSGKGGALETMRRGSRIGCVIPCLGRTSPLSPCCEIYVEGRNESILTLKVPIPAEQLRQPGGAELREVFPEGWAMARE
jgi:hypothetical protein